MKKIILILLLLPWFSCACYAQDVGEETASITGAMQVEDGLGEEEREVVGDLTLDGSYDGRGALSRLWTKLVDSVRAHLTEELRFAVSLLAIAFFCSLSSAFIQNPRFTEFMELAACCAAALLLAGSMNTVIAQAAETLTRLSDYGKLALPAFFTTVAACGSAVSASVKYAAVCFVTEIFMSLSQKLILPMIYAFLAASICSSLFENALLKTVVRLCKWCAITAMTLMTSAFCLYISLSGAISGSADALAVKTTKSVIASALPVVGGILSDSAAAMLSAAGLIKNSAGVFCLIAVCALCAGPFALLAVKMLVFKLSSALSELAGSGRYSRLLDNMGTSFGMLLGMVGSYGTMLFFSIMSGIKMVHV